MQEIDKNYSLKSQLTNVSTYLNQDYHYLTLKYDQLETKYDPILRALWCTLKTTTFSFNLLNDIRKLQDTIVEYCANFPLKKPLYIIWKSDNTNIFNLGLDIKYVHQLILTHEEEKLCKYLELCIDVLYINIRKLDINPLITISLIRGKIYGGGFEAALTSDIIIAEENVICKFPGVRYNLLPSIGMLKVLFHRFPHSAIEPILLNGKSLVGCDLIKYGVIDNTVKIGQGETTVLEKIKEMHSKHWIYTAIYDAKSISKLITQKELEEFKDLWVKTALKLSPNDVRKLGRTAEAQALIEKRFKKNNPRI
ncbi:MAG: enoyl-CoA hydratase/isomerase family protein [Gammaproteobacteria bacterium]|nr:enoyl-CoA hydratase/isomerase family protein [Gammaproteobacteria bacterium]MCW5584422.1 enoyl-CoA hydratase/isomerase family protein [Gammaproteobacteria bacterium]